MRLYGAFRMKRTHDMADKAIATYKPDAVMMPSQNEWSLMLDMASALVPTGFLPESIKNPQQAVAIMLKGRELGVPPMYALSNIVIVKGKPTISAEMMLALIYRDHGKRAVRIKTSDDTQCVIEYRLEGWGDTSSYTFSMAQATKAGLTTNPTWNKYPAAMLRARCISAVARMAYPESIAGMYVPGELGEAVTVTDEGEVLSVAEVVDQATGEIEAPRQLPEPLPSPIDQATEMRRLHVVARTAGIDHENLSGWAKSKGKASLKDVSAQGLSVLSGEIENDPAKAFEYFAKFAPVPDEEQPSDAVEPADDTQGEYLDVNDPAFGKGVTTPGMFA